MKGVTPNPNQRIAFTQCTDLLGNAVMVEVDFDDEFEHVAVYGGEGKGLFFSPTGRSFSSLSVRNIAGLHGVCLWLEGAKLAEKEPDERIPGRSRG